MRTLLILLLTLAWGAKVLATTWSISSTQSEINGTSIGVQPGDTLLLQAGSWEYITFRNMQGTVQNPIVAINDGGRVQITSNNNIYYKQGINIKGSHHFKLLGNGDQAFEYGIEIEKTNIGSGIDMREFVHHIEVANVEISNTHFSGIMVKEDPRCDGRFLRGEYIMTNFYLHHNYIHDTYGEGMYMGITAYDGFYKTCNGEPDTLYGIMLDSVYISNNLFKRIGREGVQIFSTYYAELNDNVIDSFGMLGNSIHSNGVSLGLGSGGNMSRNVISNGFGHGINHAAKWPWRITNNLIENAGMLDLDTNLNILACGIYFDERRLNDNEDSDIYNNTIVNCKNNGIRVVNNAISSEGDVHIVNNIICRYGQGSILFNKQDNDPFSFKYPYKIALQANYSTQDTAQIGFVNAANSNYRLKPSSKLLNQGFKLSGMSMDLDRNPRVVVKFLDLGAYEYQIDVQNSSMGLRSCTRTLYKNTPVFDGNLIPYAPGDTICLMGGNWKGISIRNFEGSADSPVVFRNAISRVEIDSQYYGLDIKNNRNVSVIRCVSGGIGWQISNTRGNGVVVSGNTNVVVDGVSVVNSSNAGLLVREYANDSNTLNQDLEITGLYIEQNNGKAAIHLNRSSASKAMHTGFNNRLSMSGFTIITNGAPVLMLNHNDINLELSNNEITCSNALLVDANKSFKANIYSNKINLVNADLFDLEGRCKLYFHNNIISGEARNSYLFKSRKGANGYKQRDVKLQIVNNTFNLKNCIGLWQNNNSMWDSSIVSITNNAISSTQASSFVLSNANILSYKDITNYIFDSIDINLELRDVLADNYYPTTAGNLKNAGTTTLNDTFLLDFLGENRIAYDSIDIGALISLPELGGNENNQGQTSTSIAEKEEKPSLIAYPNPASNVFSLSMNNIEKVDFIDISGKIYHRQIGGNNMVLVNDLSNGPYVVVVRTTDTVFKTKLIVRH